MPIGWESGHAVLHVVRHRYGVSWSENVRIVYVGSELTDEDTFRMLRGLGVTLRVSNTDTLTAASRRLPDIASVQTLLQWIVNRHGA